MLDFLTSLFNRIFRPRPPAPERDLLYGPDQRQRLDVYRPALNGWHGLGQFWANEGQEPAGIDRFGVASSRTIPQQATEKTSIIRNVRRSG